MDILRELAYWDLGGFPFIFWLGLATYMLLVATVVTMVLKMRRRLRMSFRVHHILAFVTLVVASLHALLGLASYL